VREAAAWAILACTQTHLHRQSQETWTHTHTHTAPQELCVHRTHAARTCTRAQAHAPSRTTRCMHPSASASARARTFRAERTSYTLSLLHLKPTCRSAVGIICSTKLQPNASSCRKGCGPASAGLGPLDTAGSHHAGLFSKEPCGQEHHAGLLRAPRRVVSTTQGCCEHHTGLFSKEPCGWEHHTGLLRAPRRVVASTTQGCCEHHAGLLRAPCGVLFKGALLPGAQRAARPGRHHIRRA